MSNYINNPMAKFMGPGLGSMWMAQDRQLDMAQQEATTGLTLEQIATQAQNRQQSAEKHPFELSRLGHEQAMQPHKLKEAELKNEDTVRKMDKQAYTDFLGAVLTMDPSGDQIAQAAQIAEFADQFKIPRDHPGYKQAINVLMQQGPEALAKFRQQIVAGSPEQRGKDLDHSRAKELETEKGQQRMREIAAQSEGQRSVEQMRIDAGKYEKQSRFAQGFQQALTMAKSATEKLAVIRQALGQAQFDPDLAQKVPELRAMEQQLSPLAAEELNRMKQPGINVPETARRGQIVPNAPPTLAPVPTPGQAAPQQQQPRYNPLAPQGAPQQQQPVQPGSLAPRPSAPAPGNYSTPQSVLPGPRGPGVGPQEPALQATPGGAMPAPAVPPAQMGPNGQPLPNRTMPTPEQRATMRVPPQVQTQRDQEALKMIVQQYHESPAELKPLIQKDYTSRVKALPKGTPYLGLDGKPYTRN